MSKNWKSAIFYILIPIVLVVLAFTFANNQNKTDLKYSEVVNLFKTNQVSEFELDLTSGTLSYELFSKPDETQDYRVPSVTYFLDDIRDSVNAYNEAHPDAQIEYNYKQSNSRNWFVNLIPYLLIIVVGSLLVWFMMKKMGDTMSNETNRTLGFGRVKAKTVEDKNKKTFADVAGCDEEKAELEELVEFLKDPQKFTDLGARIPKGVLLVGPPGTGKTLLAKAVAGEADAPFLSISGSDFVEMYVGVGASRVRDLFSQAIKKAPAIVFIDEIDAVGRHRGAGTGGGNDEREQTLNQLLVEMDGFGTNSGVIVIAATNRPDVLDPALLRPGRFDRQITVNRPDTQGREDILKVHSKNKPLGPDVNLKDIAQLTIGFTGADLENLLNEAALLAARRHKKAITDEEIQDAITRVEMGTEKKSHKYSDKAKKLTAYHEAGHAVASYFLENHDPVKEISIIPRGLGAGGYTMYQPQEENYTSKNEMLDSLVSMMGGRVAEALALDDISTGASNDLQRATQICRDMVAKYGMSDEIGPVVYSDENNEVFLGKDYGHVNNYSEETSARIDEEIEKMMRKAYERTLNILKENYDKLELIAQTLLSREKINAEEFDSLMKTGSLPEETVLAAEAADQTEAETDDTAVSEEITQNLSEESAGEQIENGSDDTVDE
ncbi:MAG TPA: ATP-dependent zinc metalloprotease FtsH [Candidatus Eubacterium faecavium]|nr:ATP-dependent zinc metalloprotease FtsH [Candidatus Eubacterium faecavium]